MSATVFSGVVTFALTLATATAATPVASTAPSPAATATAAPAPAASFAPSSLPAAKLTGFMAPYAWFAGRWACRTSVAAASAQEPSPAKLWVQVDGARDTLREEFSMTTGGKPYRSDDTLSYDPSLKAYVRRSVDINKTQIVLAAKAPYKPTMTFEGFVSASDNKLYHMRSALSIDAAQTQMTTSTSFYHADSKSWVVQSTAACSKISN